MTPQRNPASFRDPSGFVYTEEGAVYRTVADGYRVHYDALMSSGLYDELVRDALLIPHAQVDRPPLTTEHHSLTISPEKVPFISYPYEWCFGQLKAAALCTLEIQRRALAHGMMLKDASAYNIQFIDGHPVFIDTLSFERWTNQRPWPAYRQFCEQFLAPLALTALLDVPAGPLLRQHLEGIPLELAVRLLGRRGLFRLDLWLHLRLHARSIRHHAGTSLRELKRQPSVSQASLEALIASLTSAVRRLDWNPSGTTWASYAESNSYEAHSEAAKRAIVAAFVARTRPKSVWDLGANTGEYSRVAAEIAPDAQMLAFDFDPGAVERHYRHLLAAGTRRTLPLVMDLANPSPALGWNLAERLSLPARGPADLVLALALVHHLAISHNVPLTHIAAFLDTLGRAIAIEFVPKSDSQVQRLLGSREDVFPTYDEQHFEAAFAPYFRLLDRQAIAGSGRSLYLFQRLGG